MRLTLRTLLAYLDDVLEPSQAKEIGQKIKDSPVATALVERVREVMRRRRLGAPDVEGGGAGVNPNSVAEYLDNTLSPDQVAQLEKICLESDTQLAEVASVHQILTLVLGEPVAVSSETRERMYALNPSEEVEEAPPKKSGGSAHKINMFVEKPSTAAERAASLAGSGVIPKGAIPPAPPPAEEDEDRITELPEELRPQPFWKQSLPYVVILVVAGAWLGFLMVDKSLRQPTHDEPPVVAQKDAARKIEDENPAVKTQKETASTPPAETKPAESKPPETAVAAKDKKTGTETAPVAPLTEPGKPAKPTEDAGPPKLGDEPDEETKPAVATTPAKTVPPAPDGDLTANKPAASKPEPPMAEKKPMPPAEAAKETPAPEAAAPKEIAKTLPKPPMPDTAITKTAPPAKQDVDPTQDIPAAGAEYRSSDSVLLRYNSQEKHWYMKPRQSEVKDREQLAVPEPFESELVLRDGADSITLLGKTIVQWVGPQEKADCGLIINRGRVVFRPKKVAQKDKAANAPLMSVSITIGHDSWLIQMMTAETQCGVQVIPYEPSQLEEATNPDKYTATLAVATGAVRVSRIDGSKGEDRYHTLSGPTSYALVPKLLDHKVTSVDELLNEVIEDKAGTAKKIQDGKVVLGYEWLAERKPGGMRSPQWRKFEKEFDETLNQPVAPMLISYSNSKVAYESQLATSCLGLLGDYDSLVKVADRSPHEEARRTAIQELRIWLIKSPDHGRMYREDLAKHFQPEDADTLYRLTWGFRDKDGRDPETSQKLVDCLASDKMAVREAAFQQIKTLTNGRHNDYRPNSSAATRQLAIEKWKDHLKKVGALLPPEAPAADAPKPAK